MDFITDLTESMASDYTGILVIMNQLTKIAIYNMCPKEINSPELTALIIGHIIYNLGVPDQIVTDL